MTVTGATQVAGLIGGPAQVARSLSPAIHNAAFSELGMDWVYLCFPVREAAVAAAVRAVGALGLRGANVTAPHKLAAAAAVGRLEGAAARTGAVNTVEVRGGDLVGHLTDGEGLLRWLREEGVEVAGRSVLLVGARGSARAAADALTRAGAGGLTVLNRTPAHAEELGSLAAGVPFRALPLEAEEPDLVAAADLVVNATPVGQKGGCPLRFAGSVRPEAVVVDLVYGTETELVARARAAGARAFDGLGMLVHQAALAFEIWTGREAPLGAMWRGAGRVP